MKHKIIFSTPIFSTLKEPRLHFALELIENIKGQFDAEDYLHIIIDDGSTDTAGKRLKALALHDPNLIVINHKHVDGTFAFNLGIDVSVRPEKYKNLLGKRDMEKILQLKADLINYTGIDDLIGTNMQNILEKVDDYPDSTVVFWGDYLSFSANYPFVHQEFAPWDENLEKYFQLLFYVENFPSHIQYFRVDFLKEIIEARGFNIGILDPVMWSPINYELNLYITKFAIEHKYRFAFLKGNFGYKRYNISGTMTEKNRKSGRYVNERLQVFKRYNPYLKRITDINFKTRPCLKKNYFRRLKLEDPVVFDLYLENIAKTVKVKYKDIL